MLILLFNRMPHQSFSPHHFPTLFQSSSNTFPTPQLSTNVTLRMHVLRRHLTHETRFDEDTRGSETPSASARWLHKEQAHWTFTRDRVHVCVHYCLFIAEVSIIKTMFYYYLYFTYFLEFIFFSNFYLHILSLFPV